MGTPKLFPRGVPPTRRAARVRGPLAGIVTLMMALDVGVGPEIVTWPLLLAGLGIGALSSQHGAVTVASVPDEHRVADPVTPAAAVSRPRSADLECADPPLAVLPDQPHRDGPHAGAVLDDDCRLDDAVGGLAEPNPPDPHPLPGARGRPSAARRAASALRRATTA